MLLYVLIQYFGHHFPFCIQNLMQILKRSQKVWFGELGETYQTIKLTHPFVTYVCMQVTPT